MHMQMVQVAGLVVAVAERLGTLMRTAWMELGLSSSHAQELLLVRFDLRPLLIYWPLQCFLMEAILLLLLVWTAAMEVVGG